MTDLTVHSSLASSTNTRRRALLTAGAIFFVALAMRLLWISVPINIDEAVWIRRGPAFYVAVLTGDPAGTYLKHHPGVTNMWIIGAGLSVRYWLRDLLPVDALIAESTNLVGYLRALVSVPVTPLNAYVAARWASALVTGSALAAQYLLGRRVYGELVATTAAAILLFEPFFVAYQRAITTDANQTNFMWISFLSLLVYAGTINRGTGRQRTDGQGGHALSGRSAAAFWALASGLTFGLAVLSKVTTVLTLPAFALVGVIAAWRARVLRGWPRLLGDMFLWGGAVVLIALVLWPALRTDPLGTLSVWSSGLSSEVAGHDQFYLGQYTRAPGLFYYPLVLVARLSPLLLAGAVLGLVSLLVPGLRARYSHRGETYAALLLTGVILASISVFASKHDRYIVPMMPGLALTAAGGIWACVRAGQARRERPIGSSPRALLIVLAVIVVAQVAVLLPHLPYYLSYFSPLVGGPRGAQRMLMVGNGELLDKAADWLEQNVPADAQVGQRDYSASMAPYYDGRVQEIIMDPATGAWPLPEMEFVVVYSNQLQRRFPAVLVDYFAPQRPLHVVRWRGVDYAKIFPGPNVHPDDRTSLPNLAALDFGDYARLIGYELETPEVQAGETAVLTLFWEALAPFPADDFSVYVGARGAEGSLSARSDTIPVGRFAPVSRWKPGQVIRDANLVSIPPGTPPGDYTLEVGLFSPALGQALEIRDANGPRGNRVALAQVHVVKPDQPPSGAADLGIENVLTSPVGLGDTGPNLLGYAWDAPAEVTPGEGIPVSLLWRAGRQAPAGVEIVARLSSPEGLWQRPRGHLLGGAYRPESWEPGELVRDTWTVLLPADVPEGRYGLALLAILPAGESPGEDLEQPLLDLGQVAVRGRRYNFSAPAPAHAQVAELGETARLIGYDAGRDVTACPSGLCLTAGAPLELTLWWEALSESERRLTRFLHVLDAEGRLITQHDGPPGDYVATGWLPGEYIRDAVTLPAGDLPAGTYRLSVGLYDPATGQRLTTQDGQDHILLSQSLEIR